METILCVSDEWCKCQVNDTARISELEEKIGLYKKEIYAKFGDLALADIEKEVLKKLS